MGAVGTGKRAPAASNGTFTAGHGGRLSVTSTIAQRYLAAIDQGIHHHHTATNCVVSQSPHPLQIGGNPTVVTSPPSKNAHDVTEYHSPGRGGSKTKPSRSLPTTPRSTPRSAAKRFSPVVSRGPTAECTPPRSTRSWKGLLKRSIHSSKTNHDRGGYDGDRDRSKSPNSRKSDARTALTEPTETTEYSFSTGPDTGRKSLGLPPSTWMTVRTTLMNNRRTN
jgi:hypothetical protein